MTNEIPAEGQQDDDANSWLRLAVPLGALSLSDVVADDPLARLPGVYEPLVAEQFTTHENYATRLVESDEQERIVLGENVPAYCAVVNAVTKIDSFCINHNVRNWIDDQWVQFLSFFIGFQN